MRVHATTLLLGEVAVLIRGASGAGKSSLAWRWMMQPPHLPGMAAPLLARLVADDQTLIEAHHGALIARPHPAIAGRIEVRGLGIMAVPHESRARLGLVIERQAAPRLPEEAVSRLPDEANDPCIELLGVRLPRLVIPPDDPDPTARFVMAVNHLRHLASVFGRT